MLSAAHVDVCVDALAATHTVSNHGTGGLVSAADPTVLGRRFMGANIAALRALYGPMDVAEIGEYEQLREGYEHRRNEAVDAMWEPRRLATYRRVLSALDHYLGFAPEWFDSTLRQIVADAMEEYAWRLTDSLASIGTWSWAPRDRGRLPHDFGHPDRRSPWSPGLECVLIGEDEPRFFLGGEEVRARTYRVDAGAGWLWSQWCQHRDDVLAQASGPARALLREAFMDPPGGEHVVGGPPDGWMDPAPARRGLRAAEGGERG